MLSSFAFIRIISILINYERSLLDQLREMGVFACVVEKILSGAARELGITTSAVSQQIRSLEQEMEVTFTSSFDPKN